MLDKKLRDIYCGVNLLDSKELSNIYMNDKVTVDMEGIVDIGDTVGVVNDYLDTLYSVGEYVETLRNSGLIPINTEKFVVANSGDMDRLGLDSGVVIGKDNDLVYIYLGVAEIPEDLETASLEELRPVDLGMSAEEFMENIHSLFDGLPDITEYVSLNCDTEDCALESEENSMDKNIFDKSNFGKVNDYRFKLSMNGIAVYQPNSGKYVVYNKKNNEFVDVTDLLFDIKDALFYLPAVDVVPGDTVIHEDKPYYITDTTNGIRAVSYTDCTETTLIPKSTLFGIKYFTKVYSMLGDNFAASKDVFSNPMMLMMLMDGKNSDLSNIMLMNSLTKGDLGSNPMALAMLLKGDKSDSALSTLAMMSMFNNGVNPFTPNKENTKPTAPVKAE